MVSTSNSINKFKLSSFSCFLQKTIVVNKVSWTEWSLKNSALSIYRSTFPTNDTYEGTYLLLVSFTNCNNGAILTAKPLRAYSCNFSICGSIGIDGGAIKSTGSYLLINSCRFTICYGKNGGAVNQEGGQMDCFRCEFRNCTANNRGGGLYHEDINGGHTEYVTSCLFHLSTTALVEGNGFYMNLNFNPVSVEFCRFYFADSSQSFMIVGSTADEYNNVYNSVQESVMKPATQTFTPTASRSPSPSISRTIIATPKYTPQRTLSFTPRITPNPTLSLTLASTPRVTINPTVSRTLVSTPHYSPIRTPMASYGPTPIVTPGFTLYPTNEQTYHPTLSYTITPHITPDFTNVPTFSLMFTPFKTLENTPEITPLLTPYDTPVPSTPVYTIAMTPIITNSPIPLLTWDKVSVGIIAIGSILAIIAIVANIFMCLMMCKPEETFATQIV